MWEAVTTGDVPAVREILCEHPELLHARWDGWSTWLSLAAGYDNVSMVEFLVEAGLEVNVRDLGGDNALGAAARRGCASVARWLIERGATFRPTTPKAGGTLIGAVNSSSLELVRMLIERGADVNAAYAADGSPPRNALSHALFYGHDEITDLLRAHGATLPEQPPIDVATTRDEIIKHFETHWGPVNKTGFAEVVPGEVAVWVHVVPPGRFGNAITLFTTGMSDRPLTVPDGWEEHRYAELLIHLPRDWPLTPEALSERRNSWPIEWLRRAAHHMHEHRTWIGPGYGVLVNGDPPAPLAPDVPFDSLLLLGEGTEFGHLHTRDGRVICFYTVFPIYPEERVLERDQGVRPLLERLRGYERFPRVDIRRPNFGD